VEELAETYPTPISTGKVWIHKDGVWVPEGVDEESSDDSDYHYQPEDGEEDDDFKSDEKQILIEELKRLSDAKKQILHRLKYLDRRNTKR